jgi:cell division protein FtsQ
MAKAHSKKKYTRKKSEDYKRQRKRKFVFAKFTKFFQFLFLGLFILFLVWVFKFGGNEKLSEATYNVATKFFISLDLRIDSLEIKGNKVVPTDIIIAKIIESLGDFREKSIMLIDLEKIREDIKTLGWIEDVQIKKKLPDKLIFNITERTPKIIWQNKGKLWLADESGDLLTSEIRKKYLYLPIVIGQNSQKDIPEFFDILKSEPNLEKLVSGAVKMGERRWNFNLNNNIVVMLPEKDAIKAWQQLAKIEKEKAIFSKKINYIDLRIEDQLVTGLEVEKKDEVKESLDILTEEIEKNDSQ